ncbi:MAG: hypothetical protein HC860_26095 [Alkalinema sp. RU_4_3]|nr:hypothetical protein [Alkalinema sp. RU_4_3]
MTELERQLRIAAEIDTLNDCAKALEPALQRGSRKAMANMQRLVKLRSKFESALVLAARKSPNP